MHFSWISHFRLHVQTIASRKSFHPGTNKWPLRLLGARDNHYTLQKLASCERQKFLLLTLDWLKINTSKSRCHNFNHPHALRTGKKKDFWCWVWDKKDYISRMFPPRNKLVTLSVLGARDSHLTTQKLLLVKDKNFISLCVLGARDHHCTTETCFGR